MAILKKTDQLTYVGRGPLDAKTAVQTFAELLDVSKWTAKLTETDSTFVAYNGMLVAVWLNKADTTKNGIYLLHDPLVTSSIKKPDVTKEANWHKLAELSDLTVLAERLNTISEELTGVKTRLASLEADKVIIRRDNESNYRQKTPANNEICLVDVPGCGLRVKIGDGNTAFTDLAYIDDYVLKSIDNVIIKGYFFQGQFYSDIAHTDLLSAAPGRIYIDSVSSKLYVYNGTSYETQKINLPTASTEVAGITKLYDSTGYNTDGTMTQKAITDELDDKVEMLVYKDQEMLVFDTDLF